VSTVRYGHEQDEKISVSVTSRTGGTPGGRVTVGTRQGTLCVITLANGKGGCGLTAKKLPAGSYTAKASYTGGTTYARSATAKNLTVVKLSEGEQSEGRENGWEDRRGSGCRGGSRDYVEWRSRPR
jgi:hypothetical protein